MADNRHGLCIALRDGRPIVPEWNVWKATVPKRFRATALGAWLLPEKAGDHILGRMAERNRSVTMSMPTDFGRPPKGADPLEAARQVDFIEENERDKPMNNDNPSKNDSNSLLKNSDTLMKDRDTPVKEHKTLELDRNTPMTDQVRKVFKDHYSALKSRRAQVLKDRERLNNLIREIDSEAFEVETIIDILGGTK
ncbi:MAG: hypothetical protein Q8P46_07520 [Hyphomicrobiales bacterium]|nr:hypothetical protein [Hyphomicrobiales bacterium]